MSWNYGDILDGVDAVMPADAPALIHAGRVTTWADFSRRTNNLAAQLRDRGAQPGDKLAIYMRNRAEYMEALVACFKARLVQVNVNFRYLDDELQYIFDNSDARFVVFASEFQEHVAGLRSSLPKVEHWIEVGDEAARLDFATPFESLAEAGAGSKLEIERSPEDLLFIYTGGTTGMPKGVMWQAEALWGALGYGANQPANKSEKPASLEEHVANVKAFGPGPKQIPACPLMHGTGLLTAIGTISGGGCVVTLEGERFEPQELFAAVEGNAVDSIVIVGDAFAKPMLSCLEENPGRWDLTPLKVVVSSGVMWSREVKQALLKHHPGMMLVDTFGSSEAVGFGTSITTASGETRTAKFQIGDSCKVFTEAHVEVLPGRGERGFLARCGPIPAGYYKDEKKTAETFPTIAGVRYSIPGDWCTVEADGTLTLLGRGSACINTAGEKVYPEEVEEALKRHDAVQDALVVGLDDEKWGQAVTGVVELKAGSAFEEAALRSFVKGELAGYKVPKRVFAVEKMFRAPNGKADYKAARAFAETAAGSAGTSG